jgi:hypothetical protein
MNILRVTTTLCFLFFCLVSCSSVSVNQDYDTEYDFSKLKTFGFLPVPADAGIDQLSAKRIGDAVTSTLTAKGYSVSKEADFGIALHFGQQTKTDIQSWGYGWGGGAWGGWGGNNVDVTQYEEGTLVIDFVDMKEKKMIWRGSGTGVLADNPNVEQRTKKVNEAVAKIIDKFPPTPK